jgi:glycosyltransferase involved in cell wall biosynthesis
MAATEVSVVIPCHNGARFLRETLNSVILQTHRPCEIIVVDDGSTDESVLVAESFGPAVSIVRQTNQGESVARNHGIERAKGDWVAFLDADDLWEPTKLERQVEAMSPSVIGIHTNVYMFGSQSGQMGGPVVSPSERYSLEYVAANSPLHPSSLVVRKSDCPRFCTKTKYAEDLIFQLDLVRRGSVVCVPELLCGYRKHPTSQSAATKCIEIEWHKTLERWLAENGNNLPAKTVGTIRNDAVDRLVQYMRRAKWQRRWDEFETFRDFMMTEYGAHPAVQGFLRERVYPRLIYWLWDTVVRRRHRKQVQ